MDEPIKSLQNTDMGSETGDISTISPGQPASETEKDSKYPGMEKISFLRWFWSILLILILSGLFMVLSALKAPGLFNWLIYIKGSVISEQLPVKNSKISLQQNLKKLDQRLIKQKKILQQMTPRNPFLIIDTSENYFHLMKGSKLLREGSCSTGSYTLLKTENEKQRWIFKTPRGMFHIKNKVRRPIWYMPDWAFIEEGRPVPPTYSPDRIEYGVLGDYGLHLGQGYLIHGTLYQRFLGLAVTHGCVRLGDEDLEYIYKKLPIGSKVYIY